MYYSRFRIGQSAKKQVVNGKKYDSKFEAGYAEELELRLKAKDIIGFKSQVRIPLVVNGFTVCTYIVDFVIDHLDGTIEYLETKGYVTEVFRIKWKLFEALFSEQPGVKLTIIYQGNNHWNRKKNKVA
jgi:hypothetical protein